jgi:hypothetical protein
MGYEKFSLLILLDSMTEKQAKKKDILEFKNSPEL